MKHPIVALCILLSIIPNAAHAENSTKIETPAKRQLLNVSEGEASKIIVLLKNAQKRLIDEEKEYFTLLSGAPASYDMTNIPPRDAFLGVRFDDVWQIRRVDTNNRLWQPFRLYYAPNGLGKPYWDIEVILNSNNNLERVTLIYKPPAPF